MSRLPTVFNCLFLRIFVMYYCLLFKIWQFVYIFNLGLATSRSVDFSNILRIDVPNIAAHGHLLRVPCSQVRAH